MGYINLPPSLQSLFAKINERLAKLETSKRFTMPSTATDFSSATGRNGDIWLNTTSNTPKYLDNTGTVATFGGGGSSPTTSFYGTRRLQTGYKYSNFYLDNLGTTSTTATLNTVFVQPFMVSENATATSLTVFVGTSAVGGVARLGIYTNSATTDYPNTLLLDAGTISTASAGTKVITISQALTANTLYWLAFLSTTGAPQIYCTSAEYQFTPFVPQMVSTISGTYYTGWQQTGQTSFPATFSATQSPVSNMPLIWIGF